MTVNGKPTILNNAPDNKPHAAIFGETKQAIDSNISSEITSSLDEIESGIAAYQLLGGVYAQFGFDYKQMPYIDRDSQVGLITPKSLLGADWTGDWGPES
jgi:hypothetical protein